VRITERHIRNQIQRVLLEMDIEVSPGDDSENEKKRAAVARVFLILVKEINRVLSRDLGLDPTSELTPEEEVDRSDLILSHDFNSNKMTSSLKQAVIKLLKSLPEFSSLGEDLIAERVDETVGNIAWTWCVAIYYEVSSAETWDASQPEFFIKDVARDRLKFLVGSLMADLNDNSEVHPNEYAGLGQNAWDHDSLFR